MTKTNATILTLAIASLAIAAPILLAIHEAKTRAFDVETDLVLGSARDVVHRTDAAADQIARSIETLEGAHFDDPCSDPSLQLMRQMAIVSSYLQGIGYAAGGRLLCSSLGNFGAGLYLGPVDQNTLRGYTLRYSVKFPSVEGVTFIMMERSGYAAIVHKDLPIDATTHEKEVSLAAFTRGAQQFLSSRGFVKTEWIDALRGREETTFVDGGYLVAAVGSARYGSGAIAAVPLSHIRKQMGDAAKVLVPIGIVAGIILALAVLYLGKQQLALPAVLKSALRRNEFFLVFQPIADLRTGNWVGAEALIRWRRPTGEMVPPDLFIPVAEEVGLIQRITERVVELVARDAAELFRQFPDFHIGINLSSADLQSDRTVELLTQLANTTRAGSGNLIVEATERGFLNTDVAREVVREIRAGGIRIAIDDFGTGYSSLSYLESFELDFLKIDKAFVDTIGAEAATSQVVLHIIEMAKALKLEMVAEGVETKEQAEFLRNRGVRYAQGWLFGQPLAFADLVKKMEGRYAGATGLVRPSLDSRRNVKLEPVLAMVEA